MYRKYPMMHSLYIIISKVLSVAGSLVNVNAPIFTSTVLILQEETSWKKFLNVSDGRWVRRQNDWYLWINGKYI